MYFVLSFARLSLKRVFVWASQVQAALRAAEAVAARSEMEAVASAVREVEEKGKTEVERERARCAQAISQAVAKALAEERERCERNDSLARHTASTIPGCGRTEEGGEGHKASPSVDTQVRHKLPQLYVSN